MAKTKIDNQLFDRLRALGLRKGRAREVAKAMQNSRKVAPKAARKAMADLSGATAEIQDRINLGPQKRKAAAKKAARTRKLKAMRRSAAAQKAARTRKKKAKATA